jgi:hypothetical protein
MASFLKKHANLMCQSVVRPQELLFNINESVFSDWEERKPKCVPIPPEARETTLHYSASRKIRHHTLVCCVAAAGDAYCPLLVSSDPTARAVFEHQIRGGIDL